MAFQYTKQATVVKGERITSRKFGSGARARNSRYRHGLPNCAWRHHFWHFNLGRLIRCPEGVDGCGTAFPASGIGAQYPAMGELQEFYMHITDRSLGWPDAAPGDQGGINPASPLGAYVNGVENILAEVDRLSCNPLVSLEEECPQGVLTLLPGLKVPQTLEEYWRLGILQRGGLDTVAGVSGARMLDTAVSYWEILMGFSDFHHKCFGGYVPQPKELGEDCLDATPDRPATRNLEIFYTPTKRGVAKGLAVVSFPGTCPPIDRDARPKHVRFRAETPRSYYIVQNDGAITILSKKDYIEGPYKGGGLYQKLEGGQLTRVMNAYLSEFKGSDDQRQSPDFNLKKMPTAYPFRKLEVSQYWGAPNRATWDGAELNVDIPLFRVGGSLAPPYTVASGTAIGGVYFNTGEFVTAGLWAKATKLAGPATVRLLNGEREVYRFTLVPGVADPVQTAALAAGEAQHLHFFETGISGSPLRFVLEGDATFTEASGEIRIEVNDVLRYLPEIDDIFLLLRLVVANGDEGRIGNETPDPNQYWEQWNTYGCAVSGGLIAEERGSADIGNFELISDNKFYETARRLIRKTTRLFNRDQVLGYEVSGGRSVLYLHRYTRGLDQMEGLAPSLTPVSPGDPGQGADLGLQIGEGIYPGVKYWVRGAGTVIYNGQSYSGVTSGFAPAHFVGVAGQRGYTYTGSARVFEYEGILHPDGAGAGAFKPKQWSNEWLMWGEFKPYSYEGPDGPINRVHPALMGDFYPYFNGCHFYSPSFSIFQRPNLYTRMFYDQDKIIMSEAPDAWNFAEGANAEPTAGFARACQIGKPPPEIDSAVSYLDPAVGVEVVKLTFRDRFDHLPEAPAVVSADVTTWDLNGLRTQGARTLENAIMEYLAAAYYTPGGIEKDPSQYRCTVKEGDWAMRATPRDEFDNNLFGNCLPHFFAVKLAEEPPEDGNDDYDWTKDANVWIEQYIDWEIRDRVMAPGFVDEATSVSICDDVTNLMDFTYENLNFQTHGSQWISPVPISLLVNGKDWGRADEPQGYTPLIRCFIDAATFNKYAANVNALDKFRLMTGALETKLQVRQGTKVDTIAPNWGDPCGQNTIAVFNGVGFDKPDLVDGEWEDCGISSDGFCVFGAGGSVDVTSVGDDGNLLTGCSADDPSLWRKVSRLSQTRWVVTPTADLGLLVHPELLGMVQQGSLFVMGIYSETRDFTIAVPETDPTKVQLCGAGNIDFGNQPFYRDGQGYRVDGGGSSISECRSFPLSGELTAGDVGSGDALVCVGFTTTNESGKFEGGAGSAASVQKEIFLTADAVPYVKVGLKDYVLGDY